MFFYGQCVSMTGGWIQRVALGFYVYQLTGSPLMVGVIDAASRAPSLVFSLLGGVLVDRMPKQRLLQATQFLQFVIATALGLLIITEHIDLWTLGFMVFLLGTVEAFDHPARMSLPVELVGKEDLQAATALNMSVFNTARIVGPALAGWIIYATGVGWAFLLNGLSFLFPLITFSFITFRPFIAPKKESVVSAIREGLRYAFSHREIRLLLIYGATIGIFGWAYNTILPVVASEVFKVDAAGLGMLFSAVGLGAVLGAISASAIGRYFNPHKLALFGSLTFSTALFIFAFSPYSVALFVLFFVGFGQAYQNSTINARIQSLVAEHVRGRISSIQSFMLHGGTPLGSLQIGFVASVVGSQLSVAFSAAIVFVVALGIYFALSRIAKSPSPEVPRP